MKKEFKKSHNIRGTRHDIVLTKNVKNIPGFAPESYESEVCTICVKYLDGDRPFVQFFDTPPDLTIRDINEIQKLLRRGYIKKDFI